ncbi:MAG TPA: acylphosphatase [Caulobacteraceae bacterium]|nr:acylphosphatase [Caulobacteraceae bacterium]
MKRIAVLALIRGRVQGVGFRWWARGEALRLGLDGWVRNRQDGSVEVLAAGGPDGVNRFLDLCAQGPAGAAVTFVERSEIDDPGVASFEERATI